MKRFTLIGLACLVVLTAGACLAAPGDPDPITLPDGKTTGTLTLETPLGPTGTLSFWLYVPSHLSNWSIRKDQAKPLNEKPITVPGLGYFYMRANKYAIDAGWNFLPYEKQRGQGMRNSMPEMPGPEWYFVALSWDSKKGRVEGMINGSPLREPGVHQEPWPMPEGVDKLTVDAGTFKLANIVSSDRFMTAKQLVELTPKRLRGRHAGLFGNYPPRKPIDTTGRLGKVLYESTLAGPGDIEGWVMEGRGVVEFKEGGMVMRSKTPDDTKGHIVHWCPTDFPGSFVATWDCKILSDYGLNIVFFAACGENGEDIFDPRLAKRDGIFRQYTHGDIVSYHCSYYADTPGLPGRSTANLRKNNTFSLVENGPPGIPGTSEKWHTITLIKDGPRCMLMVDDRVVIDWTDQGEKYGPVLGGGKIGLRQMCWTRAVYRNLKVRRLEKK